MRIKSDLERAGQAALFMVGAALAIGGVGAAIVTGPVDAGGGDWKTADEYTRLERRVAELEAALAMYQDAAGVIVVLHDGECAERWFDAGSALGCGAAWGRFRVPPGPVVYRVTDGAAR